MQGKKIRLNHKNFFYRKIGEGPAVVLLHGFGEDSIVWKEQFNAFDGFSLIIPDLPGSGGSEIITDMSMEGLAQSVREFLNYLKVESCIMIGHSMGGYVALAFAEKFPDILRGFGLFHSTAYADNEEKKETRKKGMAFIEQHGAFEFLKTTIPNLYSPLTREKKPLLIEEQINSSHNFSAAALVSYYVSMIKRADRTRILAISKVPVLFILGKYDNAVPFQEGLQQCYLPAISNICIFEESAHMGMKEQAGKSNRIINDYLVLVNSYILQAKPII